MRALFLRIYLALGVALLLGVALVGVVQVERRQQGPEVLDVVAAFPGAVISVLALAEGAEAEGGALARVTAELGQPVTLVPREAAEARLDDAQRAGLQRGAMVLVTGEQSVTAYLAVPAKPFVATLGPMPLREPGTGLAPWMLGLGLLVLLAAVPAMLRPLDRELRALSDTAEALGQGQLAARTQLPPEAATASLAASLDEMAARVQTLLRSQRDLLHAVSHELRSPLQRVQFAVEMLPLAREPEALAARVGDIQGDVAELDALVEELLTWSALQGHGPVLHRRRLGLREVLLDLADAAGRLREGVAVTVDCSPSLEASLDEAGFRRALGNLLSNAVRYGDTRVAVVVRAGSGRVEVGVEDDGPGVPEADRQRVFEPFVRLDAARSRDTGGVGLGLAIARRMARAHGGDVTVGEGALGGARFVWSSGIEG